MTILKIYYVSAAYAGRQAIEFKTEVESKATQEFDRIKRIIKADPLSLLNKSFVRLKKYQSLQGSKLLQEFP